MGKDLSGADHMGMSRDSLGGKLPAGTQMGDMPGMTPSKRAPFAHEHATRRRGSPSIPRGLEAGAGTTRALAAGSNATRTGARSRTHPSKAAMKPGVKPAAKQPMPPMPSMPGMSMPPGMKMP